MAYERSELMFDESGPVRREPHGDSTELGELEQASGSRSAPATRNDGTSYVSQVTSQHYAYGARHPVIQSSCQPATRMELEGLLQELLPETLSGPVTLIGSPTKIGQGGQFYVYQQEVGFLDRNICNGLLVAVKRPVILKHQNENATIDLADENVQESLGHIRQEIKALTNKSLRHHPNIVRLLSWAFGEDWDRPFVLVLELAYDDLAKALKKGPDAPPNHLKVRFCSNVANGLEAIHEAGFVHRDLKPANVLIFREGSSFGFVAKLADFGFSTEENVGAAGGTEGWQAPEAKSLEPGDRFSYGLLIWSVLYLCGDVPPHSPNQTRKELALAHVEAHRGDYPPWVTERIMKAIGGLLEQDPTQRPYRVDEFFDYAKEPKHESFQTAAEESDPHALYNFAPNSYKWEIRPRSSALLNSLYRRSVEDPNILESIASEDTLTMSFHFTLKAPAGNTDHRDVRKFLEISARRYCFVADQQVYHSIIAGGLASRLRKTLGRSLNDKETIEWLGTAVDTGSLHARAGLREANPEQLKKMLISFRSRGGYNTLYRNMPYRKDGFAPQEQSKSTGQSGLHELAAFGSYEDLERYIDEGRGLPIDTLSKREETALYVACARGSWDHVELLLDRGADLSVKCTASRITCLHWIFAFDGEKCGIAVRRMLKAGADVNALIPPNIETPFPHHPFVLPAGTPLHWAVTTSSHDAIRALIEAGADPLVRNGSDPYMYDDRIRHLYALGGPDAEGCTFAESGCLGMSAVDLAAVHRDPFLLELLATREDGVDINSADEEGFTVFHRLATSQVFRTSRRVRYSAHTFCRADEIAPLRALIKAIMRLGGDIERLTSSAESATRKVKRSTDIHKSSYTPLMLAVLEADHSLVQAVLECGASVHTENESQTTALFHLSHRANAEQPQLLQCLQTLFAYGADVHHCSLTGNTPLLAAAQGMGPEIFDYFLSQGAHIDERNNTPDTVFPGKSVFAFFASFDDCSDRVMLDLLTKYVFNSSESERKTRVICDGSDSGSTLLHECAAFAMPECVKALLHYGAPVNALERKIRSRFQDGMKVEDKIYETPLDRLEATESVKWKMVDQRNLLSTKQFGILADRWDEVKRHMRNKGGTSCTLDMIREQWP